MGGFGSGEGKRPNRVRGKLLAEECGRLDANYINRLQKIPGDKTWQSRGIFFHLTTDQLKVRHNGILEPVSYDIPLDTTRPNYGSIRFWLTCPKCSTRRGKLFIPDRIDQPFCCRKCLNLADKSENHTREMRLLTKQWSIKRELGLKQSYFFNDRDRPKGMWKETFQRKVDELKQIDWALDGLWSAKEWGLEKERIEAGLF